MENFENAVTEENKNKKNQVSVENFEEDFAKVKERMQKRRSDDNIFKQIEKENKELEILERKVLIQKKKIMNLQSKLSS